MDIFQQYMEQNFVHSLARELRQEHPDDVVDLDDKELYRRINIGIKKAVSYGLDDEYSLELFTTLLFTTAPNFYHHALFQDVLKTQDLPSEQRLDYAIEFSTDEDWQEIEDNWNDGIWRLF
jgi:ADP-heptose:LPS heptosyltransferase